MSTMVFVLLCLLGIAVNVIWWLILNYQSTDAAQKRNKDRVYKKKFDDPRERYYKKRT